MSKNYERAEQQGAVAAQIRLDRQSDPRKLAQKEAVRLYPHIRKIGTAIGNIGNVAESVLAGSALRRNPIHLVKFWGVGEKEQPDSLDRIDIQRLREMCDGISQIYEPGVALTLIMADSHGQFNGLVQQDQRGSYLQKIEELLLPMGFSARWISELYAKYGLTLPDSRNPINRNPLNEAWVLFNEHREQYMESARKHHASEAETEAAAYWYVAMRLQERRMLKEEYPGSFVLVNGDPRPAKPLMPEGVPVIYLREGPVWFKTGEPV